MANDNILLSAAVGTGDTVRTLLDASNIEWPVGVAAYATTIAVDANALQIVTLTAGLPVQPQTGSTWAVTGTFWQATQPVSGTVAFSNSTIAVTNAGTFAVQATLTAETTKVIGTVNIAAAQTIGVTGTFWQATQPISAASLPLPSGAATSANQVTELASLSSIDSRLAGTLNVTGTVAVTGTFFQATQPVSLAVLPALAAGTAVIGSVTAPQGTLTDRSGSITLGGTAQSMASSNSSRKYLFIQNNSAGNIWFNFTTTAVQSQPSILLVPGASVTFNGPYISTEAVSIIGATTSQTWTAKEG